MQNLIDEFLELKSQVWKRNEAIKALEDEKLRLERQISSLGGQIGAVMNRDNMPVIVTKWQGDDYALSLVWGELKLTSATLSKYLTGSCMDGNLAEQTVTETEDDLPF